MKALEIGVYQRVSGEGPEFLSRPLVNEKERLIFTGATAAEAEERARAWYQKNFEPQRGAPVRAKVKAADEFEDLLG